MPHTPDLTKVVVLMPDKDRGSPNSSSSEKTGRESVISTQRLLPSHGTNDYSLLTFGDSPSTVSDHIQQYTGINCQLPSNVDLNALVWTTVGHEGGRLMLCDSGESVFNFLLTNIHLIKSI